MNEPRIRILSAFRHTLNKGCACAWHAHDGVEIVYHPAGRGWSATGDDGARRSFGPGAVMLYPAGIRHIQRMTEAGVDECLVLECRGAPWAERLKTTLYLPALDDESLAGDIDFLTGRGEGIDALDVFERECRAGRLLCALLRQAANAATPAAPVGAALVEAACRLMAADLEHLRQPRDVARAMGISEDHLRHIFKARRGCALRAWLRAARMRQALRLVRHSPLPIKAIAGACGFATARYFGTVFKAYHGVTPGVMRRRRRDE